MLVFTPYLSHLGFLYRDLKNHSTVYNGCDFIKNYIINFEYFHGKRVLVKM